MVSILLGKLISLPNIKSITMDIAIESFRNTINGLYRTLLKASHKCVPEDEGLSMTEIQTVGYIYRNKMALPSELATMAKITMPSMSQILKKMEKKGFCQRIPSEEDRRKVFITLTSKGKETVELARKSMNDFLQNRIQTELNEAEIEILKKAIPVLMKLNTIKIK